MNEKQNERKNPIGKVIAKALQDEDFKQQLIADPADVLKAEGVEAPEGITLKVVEDTVSVKHLVLPAVGKGELTDADLESVAGGGTGVISPVCAAWGWWWDCLEH